MNNDTYYEELLSLAEAGDSRAKNQLGVFFIQEENLDLKSAIYWYLEGVKDGYIESMWNAGTMLLNGEACKANQMLGNYLIKLAADSGYNSACLYLSYCYEKGGRWI